jgi:nicotinate-nucleotide adenylyltransferase
MNIGLFGGTFDPIHRGHIALARAALERCELSRVLFVPANAPPHRKDVPLASYFHRYAMVALATANERAFVPSLLEAPESTPPVGPGKRTGQASGAAPNYTIDTIRRVKQQFKKVDRLFFIIGIDAFLPIAKWHQAEALFKECEFIVASRPGYSLADIANALPESLRPAAAATRPFAKQKAEGSLALKGVTIHLLDGVNQAVSATAIREAVAVKKPLGKLVEPLVAEYIKKMELYKKGAPL